jgi:hypothetical protein
MRRAASCEDDERTFDKAIKRVADIQVPNVDGWRVYFTCFRRSQKAQCAQQIDRCALRFIHAQNLRLIDRLQLLGQKFWLPPTSASSQMRRFRSYAQAEISRKECMKECVGPNLLAQIRVFTATTTAAEWPCSPPGRDGGGRRVVAA